MISMLEMGQKAQRKILSPAKTMQMLKYGTKNSLRKSSHYCYPTNEFDEY